VAIPNDHGTAPGWWVERPDGCVVVALPGPPGEMRPMWRDWVLPRLRERGLGQERTTRTYRLTASAESVVRRCSAEPLLRASNPIVATYARADAVDVRISAVAESGRLPPRWSTKRRPWFCPSSASTSGAATTTPGRPCWPRSGSSWLDGLPRRDRNRWSRRTTPRLTLPGSNRPVLLLGTGRRHRVRYRRPETTSSRPTWEPGRANSEGVRRVRGACRQSG